MFNDGFYPRNEKQEMIIKVFNKFINFIENFDSGQKLLNSIRYSEIRSDNASLNDKFVINKTSSKKPDYLLIVDTEELEIFNNKSNYKLVLSLPLL